MAVINGGLIRGINLTAEDDHYDFGSKKVRNLVFHGRPAKFYHLYDQLLLICPDLFSMDTFMLENGLGRWRKSVRGRVLNIALTRYMIFLNAPQQYGFRGELMLAGNWIIIASYLRRIASVLIYKYGFPSDKFYKFYIQKDKLYKISSQWYDEMIGEAEDMIRHHKRLVS